MAQSDDFSRLTKALVELDEQTFEQLAPSILDKSPSLETIDQTFRAIQVGMEEVGRKYQEGEYYLAEMLFAAEMVNQVMPKIMPYLEGSGRKRLGTIVLGTVKGDVHDIGKNLVDIILTYNGYQVINLGIKVPDLGIDVPPARFVEAVKKYSPDIVGLSGLLTLSIDPMHETVEAIRAAGLRDQVKVIIGGNPVTHEIHLKVGSDAWANNAAEGVATCRTWVEA